MGSDSIIFVQERDLTSSEPTDETSSADNITTTIATSTTAAATTSDPDKVTSTMSTTSEIMSTNGSIVPTETTTADAVVNDANSGTVAAVVISIILILAIIALVAYFYFRRKRKPQHQGPPCFQPLRKRGSTSDSLRALDDEENNVIHKISDGHRDDERVINSTAADRQNAEQRDTFTIEDLDDEDAGKGDEYFYDEVFATSQFEDEATKNSVRQLYSTADDMQEEELLDLDFETLGIKIGDSTPVSRPRPRANNARPNNV